MADDTFKKTTDDQFVSTADDKWLIDLTVAPSKLDLAWAVQAPVPIIAIEASGFRPDFTTDNLCVLPRSFGDWNITNGITAVQNETGFDELANIAWTLGDDTVSHFYSIYQSITIAASTDTYCASLYVLKDNDETRFPMINIFFAGAAGAAGAQLNTKTGATSKETGAYVDPLYFGAIDCGLWWRFYVVATNTGSATTLTVRIFPARSKTSLGYAGEIAAVGTIVADGCIVEINSPYPRSLYVKPDLTYINETPVPTVLNLPSKQDIAYSLKDPVYSRTYLASKQDITWTVNAPTVSITSIVTVSPSIQNLTWSLKGVSISAGDYFVDTTADKWVSGADRWAFKSGAGIDTQVQVDKQTLTWSVKAPVAAFGKVVYPYDHLTDEDGNAILDEAGNPIPLEGAMDDVTLTWSIQAPTIDKTPEIRYTPADFNLTWSLQSPTATPTPTPSALQLTYTLSDGTPVVAVFPAKSDLTWTVNAPTIFGDTMPKPDALNLTWTLYAPRVGGTGLGKRRRKGLLLGVYQG